VQWTPILLSEALLALGVCVCLERLSGALPPEVQGVGSGCRVQGVEFRVQGSGCRVQGVGFRM
jgi:hypothetical protein